MTNESQPQAGESDRRKAAAIAGHRDDEPAARQALTDDSGSVRATALGALARMGALQEADVRAATSDREGRVRARAAELAATLEPHQAIPLLRQTLNDRETSVVEAACFALGELGEASSPAVENLSDIVRRHDEPLCREAAVAALGAIGDPAGLPAILDATTDRPAVRRRAVIALAPFSGVEVDAALERALEDRDWQVRQAAEDLTGRTVT